MSDVAVDTAFLVYPPLGATEDQVDLYVRRLVELRRWQDAEYANLLITGHAYEVFERCGGAPPWNETYLEGVVQARDVVRQVTSLLSRAENLEDWAGIREIYIEDCTVVPSFYLDDRPPELRDDYFRTVAIVALAWLSADRTKTTSTPILTIGMHGSKSVELQARLALIDPEELFDVPFEFNAELVHVSETDDVRKVISPVELWQMGNIQSGIELAITLRDPERSHPWPRSSEGYQVKGAFVDSLAKHGFDSDASKIGALLKACVDTILGRNQRATHPLRTHRSGAAPQIERSDGASAWRREVGRDFRLHYWVLDDTVELAAVVEHENFDIPE